MGIRDTAAVLLGMRFRARMYIRYTILHGTSVVWYIMLYHPGRHYGPTAILSVGICVTEAASGPVLDAQKHLQMASMYHYFIVRPQLRCGPTRSLLLTCLGFVDVEKYFLDCHFRAPNRGLICKCSAGIAPRTGKIREVMMIWRKDLSAPGLTPSVAGRRANACRRSKILLRRREM
ncbi:hypothetical protein BKA93DRAFT_770755 [Sparassis latifolia]